MTNVPGRQNATPPPVVGDVLLFTSDAFSTEPTRDEAGRRYDLPLGEDVAVRLKDALQAAATAWQLDGPILEDFGAVLLASSKTANFTITVSWQGDRAWALVLDRRRGCLAWLLGSKPDPLQLGQLADLVHSVVMSDPVSFRDPRWLPRAQFAGLASAFVIPKG